MNSLRIKTLWIVGSVIVLYLLVTALWIGCNWFAGKYIDEKLQGIEQQYDLSVAYEEISIKGLNRIEIVSPMFLSDEADTLACANALTVNLNLSKLLLFKAEVTGAEINGLDVNLMKTAGISFTEESKTDFALKAKQYIDILFNILPQDVSLHNLRISYRKDGKPADIHIKSLTIQDSGFETEVVSSKDGVSNEWICKGLLLEPEQKIDFRLYAKENSRISLPFITDRYGSIVQLDTLAFEVQNVMRESGILSLRGKAGVKNLAVFDERLATDTIKLNRGFASFHIDIGKNYIELHSNTDVRINKLKLNPYLKAEKGKDWRIIASLEKKDFPAEELFESIPQGLFYNIDGLKAGGTLTYQFFLDVDLANVERLKFRSTLDSRDFRILKQGYTDLRMINEPFTHTIYEAGRPVREFVLGRENPDFRPYQRISKYLPYAIMHAEDAEFFSHKGFLQDAFRRSLIQNIQEKRFARGGSTLSMQMVKNVFLSQNKTIARKLEEIMIVWLMETCRLTSKERMFEVYMNVIEWGPGIYGVTEASRFYFNKEPSALTLTECAFLAYILPNPKQVKDHFNGLSIKPEFRPFLMDAAKRINQRNWISARERATANPNLKITGKAASHLSKQK